MRADFGTSIEPAERPDLNTQVAAPPDDDLEWAERNEFWMGACLPGQPRGRRERAADPLIVCGHGINLRIDHGALIVDEGFTHFPQERRSHRYFKGDLALPPRIVVVDGSGAVSLGVLRWLAEQGVALILLDWNGHVQSAISASGYAADPSKVDWQRATRADAKKRLEFCIDLVSRKLAASLATLEGSLPPSRARELALAKASEALSQIATSPPADLTALRLIEAVCASAYFRAWRAIDMRWKSTTRRPIPDDWRQFTSRTSLGNNGKPLNVNASHPVNAMLNYAYTLLEANLRVHAIADGFDPTLGIMHHGRREKSAYVFDLMEPERPKVDGAVLQFVEENTFTAADFMITSDGVCRLSPQLARRICEVALWRPQRERQ